MTRFNLRLRLIMLMISFNIQIFGNNLQISNVHFSSINTINDQIMIEFDLSWENSWRLNSEPNNWDAVWIFIKYRINNGEWLHASLSTASADHLSPSGSIIDPTSDGMGVFIYKEEEGIGDNYWESVRLCWTYGINGLSDDETNVEIRVLGIEMVYIPEGAFYAGDNNTSTCSFKQGSNDDDPWYIGSENAINVTNDAGSGTGIGTTNLEYYIQGNNHIGEDTTGSEFVIPEEFPKGFNAFYLMKYEMSQGQYTEFLNMLTREQQANRIAGDISSDRIDSVYVMSNSSTLKNRNTVMCSLEGNGLTEPVFFTNETPDIACNFINWADGTAYSDWAGLRPITELEYEKACRGTLLPVNGEYPWGTSTVTNIDYTLVNAGTPEEAIENNYSTTQGNALYRFTCNLNGPFRVGIFAANENNIGRMTSGASYYGVFALGGSLRDRIVSTGNLIGRLFTGANGDGILDQSGEANVEYWPTATAEGSGFKGGSWDYESEQMRSSDRSRAGVGGTGRSLSRTFRAGRGL